MVVGENGGKFSTRGFTCVLMDFVLLCKRRGKVDIKKIMVLQKKKERKKERNKNERNDERNKETKK